MDARPTVILLPLELEFLGLRLLSLVLASDPCVQLLHPLTRVLPLTLLLQHFLSSDLTINKGILIHSTDIRLTFQITLTNRACIVRLVGLSSTRRSTLEGPRQPCTRMVDMVHLCLLRQVILHHRALGAAKGHSNLCNMVEQYRFKHPYHHQLCRLGILEGVLAHPCSSIRSPVLSHNLNFRRREVQAEVRDRLNSLIQVAAEQQRWWRRQRCGLSLRLPPRLIFSRQGECESRLLLSFAWFLVLLPKGDEGGEGVSRSVPSSTLNRNGTFLANARCCCQGCDVVVVVVLGRDKKTEKKNRTLKTGS